MPAGRPKLKDVAEKAGVSTATASIVLRDMSSTMISDATRRRVHKAARQLHYRHNALAASLRTGTTDLVAFVIDQLSRPTLAAKVAAAEAVLRQNDIRTVLWHTARRADVEQKALKDIRSQMATGLIIGYKVGPQSAALLSRFANDGVPMVLLEPSCDVTAHVVTVDREAVMYIGTSHLLSLGHRRIAITGDEPFLDMVGAWGQGYVRALHESELTPDEDLILHLPSQSTFEAGYQVGLKIATMTSPPTGLVCSDDEVAIGAMRACREKGIRVPNDLAIVGFDDLPVAQFAEVPLTTIGHPTDQAGRRAAELLLSDMTSGGLSSPQMVILEPELIVRESCGAALRSDQ